MLTKGLVSVKGQNKLTQRYKKTSAKCQKVQSAAALNLFYCFLWAKERALSRFKRRVVSLNTLWLAPQFESSQLARRGWKHRILARIP